MTKLTIPIEPKPQKRPRFGKFGTYEDKNMKAWRRQVSSYIAKHYKGEYFYSAISVDVTFYMKATKAMSQEPTARTGAKRKAEYERFVAEQIPHDKKPDLDNLIKAVFDSVSDSKVVWSDDNIISEVQARKVYSPNPRILLEVKDVRNKES